MLRRGSIQARLFISFSAVVLALILLFALLFYVYMSRTLAQNATGYMLAQADRISYQTDTTLDDVNRLSGKLLFSQDLLNLFYGDMFDVKSASLERQRQFNALIYAIIGPQFPPYQINLFRPTGEYAGVGNTALITRLRPETVQTIPWLNECLNKDGSKLIVSTHADDFANQRGPVVSLCRAFAPRWGSTKDSLIEIQVMYSQIEGLVRQQLSGGQGGEVFIFDPSGALVYPQGAEEQASAYIDAVRGAPGTNLFSARVHGALQVLAYTHSPLTNWTVVLTRSYASLFEPVTRFRNAVILASAAVLLLTLLVTYAISRSLTVPIRQMHQSVAELTLDTLPDDRAFRIDTDVNELQELNTAFRMMCVRLRESVGEAVAARSAAIQARLLALQAQMNPHFLYNMLATISILAERDRSAEVVEVCDSLSEMMRYISSGSERPVTIAAELRHARLYTDLMHVRFADDLAFIFAIPDRMLDITLPRLTIQPLIENCTKYATTCAPPWRITVAGKVTGDRWRIMVSDNGTGFSQVALDDLRQKLAHATATPQALELDGMGLPNIQLRLSLCYGAQAVFEYGNGPDGGAYVTVGGPTASGATEMEGGNGAGAHV
jgi:two-component system, sensor histidine kinase YesM